MESLDGAVSLQEGDFLVLPHGHAFTLASDLTVAPVDIMNVITAPLNGASSAGRAAVPASLSVRCLRSMVTMPISF